MFAVDFGAHSIRIVAVIPRRREWHLAYWQSVQIGESDAVSRSRQCCEVLAGNRWWRPPPAVVGFPASDVITRELSVPADFTDADVLAVLASDNPFPRPVEELYVEFLALTGPFAERGEQRLLLIAALRTLVNERCQRARQLGLRPVAVDVDVFALMRLLDSKDARAVSAGADKVFIWVVLDAGAFGLYVSQGRKLLYSRCCPIPARALPAGFPQSAAASPKADFIKEVATEIVRAMQRFLTPAAAIPAGRVLLAGSFPGMETLAVFLSEQCGVTAEVLQPSLLGESGPGGANIDKMAALALPVALATGNYSGLVRWNADAGA